MFFVFQSSLQAVSADADITIESLVERSVMTAKTRDLSDRGVRHQRDFIILRDLEKVLEYIDLEFSLLHDHHRSLSIPL